MKTHFKYLPIFFLFFTSTADAAHIYAFGDSYSDGGVKANFSAAIASAEIMSLNQHPPQAQWLPMSPFTAYFQRGDGRWTNGKTAVEVLAIELGTPLTNYAVGGAMTDQNNYLGWLDRIHPTGLLGQVTRFQEQGHTVDDSDVFFIFASANDYFKVQDDHWDTNQAPVLCPEKLTALAQASVANISTAIRSLTALRAKKFMVVGSSDLSVVPWEVFYHRTNDAKIFTSEFNKALQVAIETLRAELSIKVSYFDHFAFSKEVRHNAALYGFLELNQPCTFTIYPDLKTAESKGICSSPDSHYFWDEYHPTARVHELAAKAMTSLTTALLKD